MPFELKVIAEPGSATQCGGCPRMHQTFAGHECGAFDSDLQAIFDDRYTVTGYKRLPECIAAEKAQGGGGGE